MLAVVCPLITLLAAAGLCVIAPPCIRGLYLAPVGCTVALIAVAALYVAAIWSHS